mmetsp:Transcript_58611/g.96760  ORF Transcript_58611/g.96760 Transcript_58611/m.96760 type:complete len:250 (+) Transcript_58611:161-910(+)
MIAVVCGLGVCLLMVDPPNLLSYAAIFLALYFVALQTAPRHLDGTNRAYWASSIMHLMHSIVIVPLSVLAMQLDVNDLYFTTHESIRCCSIFLGYIAADLGPLLYYRSQWSGTELYIAHHLLSLSCCGTMAVRGHLHSLAVPLLLAEATAPFTNGRWLLCALGYKGSFVYVLNSFAMALSFLIFRVIFMAWIILRHVVVLQATFFALPTSTVSIALLGCGFGYPLQLWWFQKIVKGLLKVVRAHPYKQG